MAGAKAFLFASVDEDFGLFPLKPWGQVFPLSHINQVG